MQDDDTRNGGGTPHGNGLPWWQDPSSRPPGYTGTWPPPLPPGASYGPNPGEIHYEPGSTTTTGNLPVIGPWDGTPATPSNKGATPPSAPGGPGGPGTPGTGITSPFTERYVPPQLLGRPTYTPVAPMNMPTPMAMMGMPQMRGPYVQGDPYGNGSVFSQPVGPRQPGQPISGYGVPPVGSYLG